MELITKKQEQDLYLKNREKIEKEYVLVCEQNKVQSNEMRNSLKKSGFRFVGRVPLASVTIHNETKKYFDPLADKDSFKKDTDKFFNKYPEFKIKI